MREKFEAWHLEQFGWKPNRRQSGSGAYHDSNAQQRWRVWQAAAAPGIADKSVLALPSFQRRVKKWMMECFGLVISADREERNHRFLEESLELVQACGCTVDEAYQLVDYVFGRPIGDKPQEVGGVMVTLAALCLAQDMDMFECGEIELARIWTKVAQIRAKQASKPKYSPLPMSVDASSAEAGNDQINKENENA